MFKNYMKLAWRSLIKRKGFALINISGLALGFGCSLLIFLFVGYHLRYDNFHKNSDRIYRVVTEQHRDDISYTASVPPGFAEAFRNDYGFAEKVANIASWENELISGLVDDETKQFQEDIAFTEADFFDILSFPLLEKISDRSLLEPNTAYITRNAAQRLFPDKNPLGETFVLSNRETIQVIGLLEDLPSTTVIAADFFISYKTLGPYSEFLANQSWGGIDHSLQCFALLQPNQDIGDIEAVLPELVQKHRPTSKNVHHYKMQPLSDIHFNANYAGSIDADLLWIFSLIGFFLIAAACINFINISSAQSITRSKEIGIQKVLGGLRNHLFWQFISETFIISLFAMLAGLAMAWLALPGLNSLFELDLSLSNLLELKVLGFVLLLLTIVSLVSGSYPGLLLARIVPSLALKGKLTQRDAGGRVTRKVLITTQFAISIMLIVATMVIAKQISYAVNADLGFDKDAILMVTLPDELEYAQLEGLKERAAQLSGVEKISACLSSPGAADNFWGTSLRFHNRPEFEEFSIQAKMADKDYINTFGLELVAGRNFYETDSVREVVVNETLGRKLGLSSASELLGKKIEINVNDIEVEIVGVISDFHDRNFHEVVSPVFIAPMDFAYTEFAIKINGLNGGNTVKNIEKLWQQTFPKHLYEYRFLDESIAEQYESEQRLLSLSKIFSALAIFICCLGLYGIISFFVAQKTREIGIRKVLGGTLLHILSLFTIDFFKLIVIAGIVASPLAWYLMNTWLEQYQFRTEFSWWIFGIAIGGVVLIMLFSISYQTLKAALANPVKSLRTE